MPADASIIKPPIVTARGKIVTAKAQSGSVFGMPDPAKILRCIEQVRNRQVAGWIGMLVSVAFAVGVRQLIPLPIEQAPYLTYTFMVIPLAIFLGPMHATLAMVVGVAVTWTFFIDPVKEFNNGYMTTRTLVFILTSLLYIGAMTYVVELLKKQIEKRQKIELLLREVTHRGKNLMAVVCGMARQSIHGPEEIAKHMQEDFIDRVGALAKSQDLIIAETYGVVHLTKLLETQLGPFNSAGQITWEGSVLSLKPAVLQYFGIALHEMATNAVKYGALSKKEGRIDIRWSCQDERFAFSWEEIGGPVVKMPTRRGFGRTTIEEYLPVVMNGTSDLLYPADGLQWKLTAPLSSVKDDGVRNISLL